MIIVCPACSTKYTLPADAIPEDGRLVRCTECSHTWKQMPLHKVADLSKVTPPPKSAGSIGQGTNLPSLHKPPVPATLKYNAVAMLLAGAFISFLTYQHSLEQRYPFTRSLYEALQLYDSQDVALKDVSASFTRENNRLKMTFKGILANEAMKETRPVQAMAVRVLSDGGNEMGMVQYKPDTKTLDPGEEVAINSTLGGISGSAKIVVIEYGNWLEQLFY